jgi:GrpB-like predicted nucleotidyltransferase (UPF0157 family)
VSAFQITLYEDGPAAFDAYNPLSAEVAALLARIIEERNARLKVDHIGSTAVPECRGKGVVDLAVTYLEGDLEAAKDVLDSMGFQRQKGREPWPETRPMRVASILAFDGAFRIHAHVIERDGGEHREPLALRDALRQDPQLRNAYENVKQRIVQNGITDSLDYSNAKNSFIVSALAQIAKPVK